jgi:hypothetical protein
MQRMALALGGRHTHAVPLRKNRRRSMLLAGAFALSTGCTPVQNARSADAPVTQESPSPQSLVANFLAACGGADRLRRVQTLRETGTITVTDPGHAPSVGPALLEEQRPNRSRVERTVYGKRIAVAYDGREAWTLDAAGKPQPLTGDTAQGLARNEFDHFLLDYDRRGIEVSTAGVADLPSGSAFKLRAVLRSGEIRYSYIDRVTHLELRRDYEETDGSTSVQRFRGHRLVSGLMLPTEYETEYPNGRRILTRITPEIDLPIDESRFSFRDAR